MPWSCCYYIACLGINRLFVFLLLLVVLTFHLREADCLQISFQGIQNFREIAVGKVYRSAALDQATETDQVKLSQEIKLKTVIDLRDAYERRDLPPWLRGYGGQLKWISLLEGDRFFDGVYRRWPLQRRLQAALFSLINASKENQMYIDDVNDGGLRLLNQLILQTNKEQILEALQIISEPANHPVVFNCVKGKDRTGILAMLVNHCLGLPAQDIISEYALSERLLREPPLPVAQKLQQQLQTGNTATPEDPGTLAKEEAKTASIGSIDWSRFQGTPPQAMEHTLAFLESEYGGVNGYLDSIGFDDTFRRRLKDNLQQ